MSHLPQHRRPKNAGEAAPLFARVFSTEEGERVFEHLWRMTLDQATGPHVTDAHLRHLEGQRFIVKYISHQIEKGQTQHSHHQQERQKL